MSPLIAHIVFFTTLNVLVLLLGYTILKHKLVWLSWALFVASIGVVTYVFNHENPIMLMLAIIATTFSCMKVIAVTESYKNKPLTLSLKHWLIYAAGWAGMRAEPFEAFGSAPIPNAWSMVRFGVSRVVIGLLLIFLAHKILLLTLPVYVIHGIVSIVLLIGLSLILHFGLLGISAGMWRFSGVNTYLLFRQPAAAISLAEFWSKRWNIAFSEMTSVAIFRPLKKRIGAAGALMTAFIFSGFLHELALSVPVKSGYGLPTLYFIIQGCVVLAEKYMLTHKIRFLQSRVVAKIWLFFWLVIPAPLLFHYNFIKEVVWPLAGLKYNFAF